MCFLNESTDLHLPVLNVAKLLTSVAVPSPDNQHPAEQVVVPQRQQVQSAQRYSPLSEQCTVFDLHTLCLFLLLAKRKNTADLVCLHLDGLVFLFAGYIRFILINPLFNLSPLK